MFVEIGLEVWNHIKFNCVILFGCASLKTDYFYDAILITINMFFSIERE